MTNWPYFTVHVWMPDQLSGRVLAVFFWFTLIIVSNIYKGNLIASLAIFTPKLPFLTLEEVAADEQYTILMVNDSSQRTLLEVQYFYRPHPKDGGRYCFQFVCQSTPRRGGGVTPSQVWVGGVPHPRCG